MDRLPRHELHHADGRGLWLYGHHEAARLPTAGTAGAWPALHLRHDALTDSWVAISPARNTRPQSHAGAGTGDRSRSAGCPLCVGGPELPFDHEAAVFENRFPTLLADPPTPPPASGPTRPSRGRCEVVLYTPTHTGSLATLTARELGNVVAIWTDRSRELWLDPALRYVLVFENRGEDVGATLSHPHGQIYAFDHVPPFARLRGDAAVAYRQRTGRCVGCDLVVGDDEAGERTIVANPSFSVAVPFAAQWPLEVHVRARRHGVRRLTDLDATERRHLAAALRDVVHRYDRLYGQPIAYLMVCQQAPDVGGAPVDDWHLSVEFLPPNRAPDTLKVRASVETAAGLFINDTIPEVSAHQLAALPGPPGDDTDIPDVEVVVAGPPGSDPG